MKNSTLLLTDPFTDPTYGASYDLNQALASGVWGYVAGGLTGTLSKNYQSIFTSRFSESIDYTFLKVATLDLPLGTVDQAGEDAFQEYVKPAQGEQLITPLGKKWQ